MFSENYYFSSFLENKLKNSLDIEEIYKILDSNNVKKKNLFNSLCLNRLVNLQMLRNFYFKNENELGNLNSLFCLLRNPSVEIELIKFLVEKGAKISELGKDIHAICQNSSITPEILKYLIENGSVLNQKIESKTELHFLFENKKVNLELVKILIESGSFVFDQNLNLIGILLQNHIYPTEETYAIINYLISKGVDPIQKDISNRKPSFNTQDMMMKQFLDTYYSYNQDFLNFFRIQKFGDSKINDFLVHKTLIEIRTGKTVGELSDLLAKHSNKQIKMIFKYLYCGLETNIQDSDLIDEGSDDENIEDNTLISILETDVQIPTQITEKKTSLELIEEIGIKIPHNLTLQEQFGKLFQKQDTKDFVIKINEQEIKVHKLILEIRSELFRQLFTLSQDDSSYTQDFTGRSFNVIDLFVKFLYTDQISDQEFFALSEDEQKSFDFDFFVDYFQLNRNSRLFYFKERFQKIEKEKKKELKFFANENLEKAKNDN
ncbi:speckle-type poz protein [Anaeramoeba ignava]|uniref:Speckle-type poz protein n=1 Tax=Anaeramoeba ignava TaxID=1746090 RepID=A0A9Q0R5A5_ANAIG|nr:speckle-type poz protein [Anaeramoeba ignava]